MPNGTPVPGTPDPEEVNCSQKNICGHVDPNNATQPDIVKAYIWDDPDATPDPAFAAEVGDWTFDDTVTPPTFQLNNVSADMTLSGDVRVLIIFIYGIAEYSADARLTCGSGCTSS